MTQGFGPCCFIANVGSNPTTSSNLDWGIDEPQVEPKKFSEQKIKRGSNK